jgi:hypothetical protein
LVPRKFKQVPSGDEGAGAQVFCFFFSKNKFFLLPLPYASPH